jgi:hypothetical protein
VYVVHLPSGRGQVYTVRLWEEAVRKTTITAGVLDLVTHVISVTVLLLYGPVLGHPG